jgi:hypothetical protein
MSVVSAGKNDWLPGTDRYRKNPEDVVSEQSTRVFPVIYSFKGPPSEDEEWHYG